MIDRTGIAPTDEMIAGNIDEARSVMTETVDEIGQKALTDHETATLTTNLPFVIFDVNALVTEASALGGARADLTPEDTIEIITEIVTETETETEIRARNMARTKPKTIARGNETGSTTIAIGTETEPEIEIGTEPVAVGEQEKGTGTETGNQYEILTATIIFDAGAIIPVLAPAPA